MPIFVNGEKVELTIFPGGECHIRLDRIAIGERTDILAQLRGSDDIMCLLLIVDAVRRIRIGTEIHLIIPYFPYARQDRVCNEGEALSAKVMADLVNGLECASVTVFDPHSDVSPALLNRCIPVSLADLVASSPLADIIHAQKLVLLSPDAGAEKKIRTTARKLSSAERAVEVLCASKTRETANGNIIRTQIHGPVEGRNFIILDDICDGGRTFIELAKAMKEKGAGEMYLYVTHGIFSQGIEILAEHFTHIYCCHTMLSEGQTNSAQLTVLGMPS